MAEDVIDVGSNLPENLERWAEALKGGGAKLAVFKVIYSKKTKFWKAREISAALSGRISPKRVTEVGNRLVGDLLIRQVPGRWPVVYEKIGQVHHLKARILKLAANNVKRQTLVTKRRTRVVVQTKSSRGGTGGAREVSVDAIDQFKKVQALKWKLRPLVPLSEDQFKAGLQWLLLDAGRHAHWAGEQNDLFVNKLSINGTRHFAAFALKGPGVGVKTMKPGDWGRNGDQIQKLSESPASVFFLQFEGQIDSACIDQLKKLTQLKGIQEGRWLRYGVIDGDDSLRLRHAYPGAFV